MKHRHLFTGFVQLHVLYHAAKESICGAAMAAELRKHGYTISPGTLYPLLQRLERKGYLRSRWEQQGRESRRFYRATPMGTQAVKEARVKIKELFGELLEDLHDDSR